MIDKPPIERLDLYRLALPLQTPWRTSYGTETTVETIYGKATAGDQSAWFETCPLRVPTYMPDCAASTLAVLQEHLASRAIGCTSPAMICERLADVRGNTHATNLLEGLAWSLQNNASSQIRDTIGASGKHAPEASATYALQSPKSRLFEQIAMSPTSQIRLKFTAPKDLQRLQEVCQQFPRQRILIDCNGAFSLEDIPLIRELDQLRLVAIEQPLHYRDLVNHARLQDQINTPICLDESITCYQDAETAIAHQSCRAINLKPGRLGGIAVLKRILEISAAANIDCFIGGMLESHLGTTWNRALACLPGITLPSDLPDPSQRYSSLPPANFTEDNLEPFTRRKAVIGV